MNSGSLQLFAGLLIAAMLTACTTTGQKQASKTTGTIEQLRDDLIQGKAQIDATMTALNTLANTTSGDLKKPYDTFRKEVVKLQSIADKAASRREDMVKRASTYETNWQKQLSSLDSNELRARGEQARENAQQRLQEIEANMNVASETFQSFMGDLRDIQAYLDFNLNAEGVASITDIVETANADAATCEDALDDLIGLLDRIAAKMSSKV